VFSSLSPVSTNDTYHRLPVLEIGTTRINRIQQAGTVVNIMSEPIIIKGKLYLEEYLNTVWIYNDDDTYINILDFLKTINLQRVTITVTVDL
jgi:hypothetical protein